MRIRPARLSDLTDLAEIWRELMRLHETSDRNFTLAEDANDRWRNLAEDMIGREDGFLLFAEQKGEAAGFCLGWVARNPPIYEVTEVGFISEIAVREKSRRCGVGRALVEAARAWFAGRDLAEFQLSTAVWNEEARAFWKALGGEQLLVRYRFEVGS